jgi:multidrug efflux system membrane fusion protein
LGGSVETAGLPNHSKRGRWIALAIIGLAIVLVAGLAIYASSRPSTDDASIDADIVHVAPEVGGRIIAIAVSENERVRKGSLLFQIDPQPYSLAISQAEADLRLAEAELSTRRRFLATQRSTAVIAADQTRNAQANYGLASRTTQRLGPLTAQGFVPKQQLDQAEVTEHDAATAVRQAQQQQAAAQEAIDTEAAAVALVSARRAALGLARRHLADTTVRATHDGLVVGLTVSSGEFVAPAQALFTLINTEAWFAMANFRETDLRSIAPGSCVTVFGMGSDSRPIKGIVEGLGWGVLDEDRINLPRSLPYVERSLNWVRVAQRFPVRVKLQDPPPDLRLGESAVVEVNYGASCR